ncbi:uncharacterized protein Dwil_GK27410 [Drosophila willistoni]|uniref:Uncharacterized protein n=1 Tax=Drosophila willistoni TaxID=7260 RepID=A0A0Q9WV70_DROWI|nr:uncharacterized protein LOC26529412 [Drosophila willistoni]KRG00031.1 uncharacterized protein Dwil_GK27410 [Drosophila willistoni]
MKLKFCCYCLSLRVGCCLIALLEIIFNSLGLIFGDESNLLLLGRAAYMFHLLGSIMLLMSTIKKVAYAVTFYLVSNGVHLILCTIFVIDWSIHYSHRIFEAFIPLFALPPTIYFWLVAYSYRKSILPESLIETVG